MPASQCDIAFDGGAVFDADVGQCQQVPQHQDSDTQGTQGLAALLDDGSVFSLGMP